jgi:hypothetical protein
MQRERERTLPARLCMADVQVAIWLWGKSSDDPATCGLQVLRQLLPCVAEVPLPAIAEIHCRQHLHVASCLNYVCRASPQRQAASSLLKLQARLETTEEMAISLFGSVISYVGSCGAHSVVLTWIWKESIWVGLRGMGIAICNRNSCARAGSRCPFCRRSTAGHRGCRLLLLYRTCPRS